MVTVSTSRRQWCTRRVTGQLWFPMATTRRSVKTFLELAPSTALTTGVSTRHTSLAQRPQQTTGIVRTIRNTKEKVDPPVGVVNSG
ncbi:hypothetical protein NP493_4209g00000 [Ridgeia piscesae]|uniref:Uncharacterized protein n=1 Tax=Ridgeia piscesae TaxID=27915 RepID=A0AAD9MSM5_RIDPI|nr:hypothetical protein NP493_4209g00000 [Ridgeia piscesae]